MIRSTLSHYYHVYFIKKAATDYSCDAFRNFQLAELFCFDFLCRMGQVPILIVVLDLLTEHLPLNKARIIN